MSTTAIATPRNGHWLPLRFALRELRGGLRGFYVFIACIALGCMAIAGVGSLTASLVDGLARQGQVILGGDLSFTLIQREVTPDERAFLESHGKLSSAATMRAMARNRRRQCHAGRNEGGRQCLSAVRRSVVARSARCARRRAGAARRRVRRRGRSDPADAARHQAGRAARPSAMPVSKSAPRSPASRTSLPAASASDRDCS